RHATLGAGACGRVVARDGGESRPRRQLAGHRRRQRHREPAPAYPRTAHQHECLAAQADGADWRIGVAVVISEFEVVAEPPPAERPKEAAPPTGGGPGKDMTPDEARRMLRMLCRLRARARRVCAD